jgi:hypothetical protein
MRLLGAIAIAVLMWGCAILPPANCLDKALAIADHIKATSPNRLIRIFYGIDLSLHSYHAECMEYQVSKGWVPLDGEYSLVEVKEILTPAQARRMWRNQ